MVDVSFNPRNVRFGIKKINDKEFGIVVGYRGSQLKIIMVKGSLSLVKGKYQYILQHKEELYQFVYNFMFNRATVA